jgi:hypothetical protein
MDLPLITRFIDKRSGGRVPGFIGIATDQDLLRWTAWRYRPADEDRTWDWWEIYLDCKKVAGRYQCYAARAMGDLQGLMLLDVKTRKTRVGKAITVDYLATNPANREPNHGLKCVGVALMATAVASSVECNAGGVIQLESLPGAARFYESLGMSRQPGR